MHSLPSTSKTKHSRQMWGLLLFPTAASVTWVSERWAHRVICMPINWVSVQQRWSGQQLQKHLLPPLPPSTPAFSLSHTLFSYWATAVSELMYKPRARVKGCAPPSQHKTGAAQLFFFVALLLSEQWPAPNETRQTNREDKETSRLSDSL